ncbi:MAG TPA: hypothetical protein VFJ10_14925 [Acidobacteriaceae bacterium]|nr:hypothetical protein [Acidobacteriaceae bacterium]
MPDRHESDEIERLVEARARWIARAHGADPDRTFVFRADKLPAQGWDEDATETQKQARVMRGWEVFAADARATLDADAALGLPAETLAGLASGRLVAVPVEPSEGMVEAGGCARVFPSVYMGGSPVQARRDAARIYRAMLAAAKAEKAGREEE